MGDSFDYLFKFFDFKDKGLFELVGVEIVDIFRIVCSTMESVKDIATLLLCDNDS